MNHKYHLLAGLVSGISVAAVLTNYVSTEVSIVGGVTCFFGSEFPDLDTNSIPSLIAARVGFATSLVFYYFEYFHYSALIGMVFMLIKSQPHRGITHSYLLPLVLFILAVLIVEYSIFYAVISWGFGFGLIVHNGVVDRMNPFNLKCWFNF